MGFGESTSREIEEVASQIVDAAFRVHSRFGPGLLESVYEACLCAELTRRGLDVVRQMNVPVEYDGLNIEIGFRADLLVNGCVLVEVKAVEQMHAIHRQQVKTYIKLLNLQLGFLINFNVPLIKDGIERIIQSHR